VKILPDVDFDATCARHTRIIYIALPTNSESVTAGLSIMDSEYRLNRFAVMDVEIQNQMPGESMSTVKFGVAQSSDG
jgi:hypothetical protein